MLEKGNRLPTCTRQADENLPLHLFEFKIIKNKFKNTLVPFIIQNWQLESFFPFHLKIIFLKEIRPWRNWTVKLQQTNCFQIIPRLSTKFLPKKYQLTGAQPHDYFSKLVNLIFLKHLFSNKNLFQLLNDNNRSDFNSD